jgi:hypothetical protein
MHRKHVKNAQRASHWWQGEPWAQDGEEKELCESFSQVHIEKMTKLVCLAFLITKWCYLTDLGE